MPGYRRLENGQLVQFEAMKTDRGIEAVKAMPVDAEHFRQQFIEKGLDFETIFTPVPVTRDKLVK